MDCPPFDVTRLDRGRTRLQYAFERWRGPASSDPLELHARVNEEYYRQRASVYEDNKRWSYLTGLYHRHVGAWLRRAESPVTVFDVGAGTGFVHRIFLERGWSVERYHYIEPSIHMREQHVSSGGSDERLSFHDFFDGLDEFEHCAGTRLVITNSVLHHVLDPRPMIARIRRTMRPGDAWLVAQEPNAHFYRSVFGRVRRRLSASALRGPGPRSASNPRVAAARQALIEGGWLAADAPTKVIEALVDYWVYESWEELPVPEDWNEGYWSFQDLSGLLGPDFRVTPRSFSYLKLPATRLQGLADEAAQRALPMRGRVLFCMYERHP